MKRIIATRPMGRIQGMGKKIEKMRKCTREIYKKRVKIYDTTILQSSISTVADLSIDMLMYQSHNNYDIQHYIIQHMLTYLTTNLIFLTYDIAIEFQKCDDDFCEIGEQ